MMDVSEHSDEQTENKCDKNQQPADIFHVS